MKFFGATLLLLLAGCSFSGRPVIGTILHYGEPVQITLPPSVGRGQPFIVSVVTYGGGCLKRGFVEIQSGSSGATVTPYDVDTSMPDVPCTLELAEHRHTTHLRFDEPGRVFVRVVGLRRALNEADARIVETRLLTVR